MLRLLTRRLATGALTLFLITLLVFALIHFAPGDPLAGAEGEMLRVRSPEAAEAIRRIYRLDLPPLQRYRLWIGDLVRGDLGVSIHDKRPVTQKITERLGITVALNAASLVLMVLLAVPLGAAAALRPGSRLDRWSGGSTYVLYAVPVFWAGLLLQIVFAVKLGWFPLAGLRSEGHETLSLAGRLADRAAHMALPVICLTYGGLAYLSRFVRATLLENASETSALAARARGLSGVAVLYRHGFRLAAIPMLTLAGLLIPGLVGGSVIVETIFAIPGLGRLFFDAVMQRDVPVVLGLTLLAGSVTVAGIVAADVAYGLFDPRVRRG
ncbi:MAG: ABC transporter permease [bacterium]|nr:ABC transporter permease [bacterium]